MAVVLITGANSGFGLAGVRAFANNGDHVVATVRNAERRQELQTKLDDEGLLASIEILELTKPDTFSEFFKRVIDKHGRVDVLVNNAGVIRPGACEDLSEADLREVMEVNFMAPMLLTRTVLPQMRKQAAGLVIMVSSLSGIAGLAGDVVYSASKFALEGATEALQHEVDRFGVRVALIEAAQYSTNLFANSSDKHFSLPVRYPAHSPYRKLVESKLQEVASGFAEAGDPQIVGDLMLSIAQSDSSQLRWPADELSEMVLSSLYKLSDDERDKFLRRAAGIDWWSGGHISPAEEGA